MGRGTGLGLAVLHRIVESHQGVITVESHVGHGTTFTLYFPAQAQVETLPPTDATVPHGYGQKILAVDDEPALTDVLQKMLRRLDYQVTTSNQATELNYEPRLARGVYAASAHAQQYASKYSSTPVPGCAEAG